MRNWIWVAALLVVLAGCSPGPDGPADNRSESDLQPEPANAAGRAENSAAPRPKAAEEQVGMFRWSSGMQMGSFWAGVQNGEGDFLRLFSEADGRGNAGEWDPEIEISDPSRRAQLARNDTLNLVVGNRAWVFGYEAEGGTIEPTPLSMSGHADMQEFLAELQTTSATAICAEFPQSDYRTCFSTAGMREALGPAG